ncbi:arylformamidase [Tumebacillus avium]|uniref:Kynurenine formamidase n=1 Tax=Tumebacillus avium TaxID=1903704 RepID=A0A1Y0IJC5_9BACL|nr:arylformamidase [Tumebacillus avium]ARU60602.1 arylformamidase [Tumebacillus avium]
MKIYDITMPISAQTAPFPGDTPFGQEWVLTMREGGSCNVSKITMSPHLGTHADAPYHYHDQGATTEQADLNLYIGEALVVDVPSMPLVTLEFVQGLDVTGVQRLLFKTSSFPDPHVFSTNFTAIAPEAALYLAEQGVRLIGIDTPSVDPADSKTLDAHNAFFQSGLHILENLRLDAVPQGRYELIALPLHLVGSDASPVRAILRQL